MWKIKTCVRNTSAQIFKKDLDRKFLALTSCAGQRYFGCLIGAKGDLKHHMECGNLDRSYHTMGAKTDQMMCSLCWAGDRAYPFEDCSDQPDWAETLGASRPWSITPNLALVPGNPSFPEQVFLLDPFHLFKVGLARDLAGSSIIAFSKMKFFDTEGDAKNIPARLERAHKSFQLWCLAERKAPGLRSFTRTFLNFGTNSASAWSNSKGSDSMLLLKWLLWFVSLQLLNPENITNDRHLKFCKVLKHTIDNGLKVFALLHSHPLWLQPDCAKLLYKRLMILLRGYKSLAQVMVSLRMSGYALKPKFHGTHHVAYAIKQALERRSQLVLSPLFAACEQNEDVVGRISRLSRRLATRTLTRRVLQRHFLKKSALLRRSTEKHKCSLGPRGSHAWAFNPWQF